MSNKVIPITVQNSGCSYHRIEVPYTELGYTCSDKAQLSSGNLFIINRVFPADNTDEILAKGNRFILDLDDYWEMPPDHPMYQRSLDFGTKDLVLNNIRKASAVTVTNIELYNLVKPHNKEVHIIPNSIPFGKGQFQGNNKKSDTVKFIYAGSFSHSQDIEIIADVVNESGVDFCLTSRMPNNPDWEAMRGLFKSDIETQPNRNVSSYMYIYDGRSVSLVPLVNSTFSNAKSNLKVLEAGCKGLHVIASKILPYYNPLDRQFIDFASNRYEWYEKIRYCKMNKSYVEERGLSLQEHVKEHYDLTQMNVYRKQLIEYVIKKG